MISIAIQKDNQLLSSGRRQTFSSRWHDLAGKWGFEAHAADAYAAGFFDELVGHDGFMWWFAQPHPRSQPARRIIAALNHARPGFPTFPNWDTIWHFDDKASQAYLLNAAGIPTPQTWVFWDLAQAEKFLKSAVYPLVLKLPSGMTSRNVALLRDAGQACHWARRLFGRGTYDLGAAGGKPESPWKRLRSSARRALLGPRPSDQLSRGCMLVQEFLPGNDFDTRITVIGERAFAFRRHNRPGDFRASGSGRIDWELSAIAPDALQLAFRAARTLQTQSLAVDVLRRDGELVIAEISYYYEGWAVASCPGHWVRGGTSDGGKLSCIPGPMPPEDAILEDFLNLVRASKTAR
jgi:glutathione synthase/RimK-type ligase-like ATP-grasp enzyme